MFVTTISGNGFKVELLFEFCPNIKELKISIQREIDKANKNIAACKTEDDRPEIRDHLACLKWAQEVASHAQATEFSDRGSLVVAIANTAIGEIMVRQHQTITREAINKA